MTHVAFRGSLLRRSIVVVGLVLILAFAASWAFDVWRSYGQSLAAVDRELGNLARALAAEAARRFQSIEVVLRDTETWFEANAGRASPKQAAETLEQLRSGLPLGAIYITDAAGALVYSSDPLPAELVSAEPRSIVFLNGRAMLILSRELNAGRANALLELSAFQELYDAIELSPGNTIALYRNDGMLLTRRPYAADRVGWKFPQWDEALQSISRQELASPRSPPLMASPIDGRMRFRSLVHVRDFPFSVMTTRDETAALASWRELAVNSAVRTVVLSLLGVLLIAALVRQVARGDAGEQAVREQAALLDLTRDTVFVRDTNDVITYWNRGAEDAYGWSRSEAIGGRSHELLRTEFPAPVADINAELERTGHWEGELVHRPLGATRRLEGLADEVERVESALCATDLEALILEDREIRRLEPRFNTYGAERAPRMWMRLERSQSSRRPATRTTAGARTAGALQSPASVGQETLVLFETRWRPTGPNAGARGVRPRSRPPHRHARALCRVAEPGVGDSCAVRRGAMELVRHRHASAVAMADHTAARRWSRVLAAVRDYDPSTLLLPADPRESRYAVLRPSLMGIEGLLVERGMLFGSYTLENLETADFLGFASQLLSRASRGPSRPTPTSCCAGSAPSAPRLGSSTSTTERRLRPSVSPPPRWHSAPSCWPRRRPISQSNEGSHDVACRVRPQLQRGPARGGDGCDPGRGPSVPRTWCSIGTPTPCTTAWC